MTFNFFSPGTRTSLVALGACPEGLERFDASDGMEFPGLLTRGDVGWLLGKAARSLLLPPSFAADACAAVSAAYTAYAATSYAAAAADAARTAADAACTAADASAAAAALEAAYDAARTTAKAAYAAYLSTLHFQDS